VKSRYKNLFLTLENQGKPIRIKNRQRGQIEVWFQDKAIADLRTPSKVGAVTVEVREISNKSGVSHLLDWAAILGILSARHSLTAHGRMLASVSRHLAKGEENPYIIGAERVAFGWLLFSFDADVIPPLIRELAASSAVTKGDAMEMIVQVYNQMQKFASTHQNSLSSRATRGIRELREDLGGRRAMLAEKPTNTAWHRVSSRLESLVDLGLLQKQDFEGGSRQYDYYYRPTSRLLALHTALQSQNLATILQTSLAAILFNGQLKSISLSDEAEILFNAVRMLMGPTGVHIDSCAVGASVLAADRGILLEPGTARERLINLALQHPEVARLARGYTGSGAEFMSVSMTQLGARGPAVFH
jgi:hypothetical protein